MRVRLKDLCWDLVVVCDDPNNGVPDHTIVWQSTGPTMEEWGFHDKIRKDCVIWYRAIKGNDGMLTRESFGELHMQPLLSKLCPEMRIARYHHQWAFCVPNDHLDLFFENIGRAIAAKTEKIPKPSIFVI